MVFLPEAYDYLGETKQESLAMAQSIKGPRMKEMCQLAKDNDIWLSLGGFHNKVIPLIHSDIIHLLQLYCEWFG